MKEFSPLSEIETLKLVYYDILNGYSLEGDIYVKHFSEQSYARILERKRRLALFYQKEGLITNEAREKEILEQGIWSQEREDRITQLKYLISDNEKYAQGMVIPAQKKTIMAMVEKNRVELTSLQQEKEAIVGPTCERFADRELENGFLTELFYKDPQLSIKYFTAEEIDEMDNTELLKFRKILNRALSRIDESHVKRIGCLPFFINSLSAVKDRPEAFYGRPLSQLTFHQHNLLIQGLKSINIHSQADGSPPSLIDSSLDELVKWYDTQESLLIGKSGKKGTSGGFNITNQDVVR